MCCSIKNIKISLLLALLCSLSLAVQGQDRLPLQFRLRLDVPLATPSGTLTAPWSGGLNAPQFSTIDLNKDGQADLFIFDRAMRKVFTYLAVQQSGAWRYEYTPQYEVLFPAELVALVVYDAIERSIYTEPAYSFTHTIPLKNLRTGVYVVQATAGNGKSQTRKLVIF